MQVRSSGPTKLVVQNANQRNSLSLRAPVCAKPEPKGLFPHSRHRFGERVRLSGGTGHPKAHRSVRLTVKAELGDAKRVYTTSLQNDPSTSESLATPVEGSSEEHVTDSRGGNGNDSPGGNGGGGGDGRGDGEGSGGDEEPATPDTDGIAAKLSKNGFKPSDLQPGLAEALTSGRVAPSVLNSWMELQKVPYTKFLSKFSGFLERMLGDKMFLTKVGIECGVGLCTKAAAEKAKRQENFSKELDFVFANVLMAIIADFMLVWIPAPTISLASQAGTKKLNAVQKFMAACPDNAFQKVQDSRKFTLMQRGGAVLNNGTKLLGVGLFSSFISTTVITGSLLALRSLVNGKSEAVDSKDQKGKKEEKQNDIPVIQTCACYGAYMATSSNIRYQVLAGFEQRVLEPMLSRHTAALGALCFALRTGNTFLGSLLWVDFARICGIQPKKEEPKPITAQ
eukprot:CAMPEP_0197847734 /NCGR_PEP_ID=MMETSP1438-20131217/6925_1 /TAXON_ID=1461541 /ORGANISM="Pterosperma sp., Strain CCMP1384" /LENGTH=451 /DNA_ID=CAMNT_0043459741 /DNA_START=216 /DNA_END=1571 /DNA_ORIENTATION=+